MYVHACLCVCVHVYVHLCVRARGECTLGVIRQTPFTLFLEQGLSVA